MLQSTIKKTFSLSSVGVHSNAMTQLIARPAEINTGIVFVCKGKKIHASYDNVTETLMSTKISNQNGDYVTTIEHLSAALYALNITNIVIELDSNEMPIMDGSAKVFIDAILNAEICEQNACVDFIKILKPVTVSIDNKHVLLTPADSFILDVECDFSAKGLHTVREVFEFGKNNFITNIAPARTFGFIDEVEYIRSQGLAQGASFDNTLVFDNRGNPINENGLRIPNEPVRHKLLDAIGDLSLANGKILGKYDAYCPGHKLNNLLLRKLFSDKSNYEIYQ